MDFYAGPAQFAEPYSNWATVAPYEPPKTFDILGKPTESYDGKRFSVSFFEKPKNGLLAPTAIVSETLKESSINQATAVNAQQSKATTSVLAPAKPALSVDVIVRQRVELLQASYVQGPRVAEITARLRILNTRLMEAAPRVTKEQVEQLEAAEILLKESRASLNARAERLGIKL